jgi:hypothetical protein
MDAMPDLLYYAHPNAGQIKHVQLLENATAETECHITTA